MRSVLPSVRLLARLAGAVLHPGRLSYLVLFVTDECNAKCPYCFNVSLPHLRPRDAAPPAPRLSLAEYERLAERVGPLTQLVLSGGEPFLRDDIDRIVAAFYRRCGPALVSIPTNGSLPERALAKAEAIAASCPGATLNLIVSLDAVGGKHDRLRGVPGGFDKAVGLCRALVELRARRGNVNVIVTTAVTEANVDDVDELSGFLRSELPAGGWHHNFQYDQRLGARGAADPSLAGKLEGIERAFLSSAAGGPWARFLARWYVGFINRLIRRQLAEDRMLYRCVAGDRLAVVLADGRLSPCEPFAFEAAYRRFEPLPLRERDFDVAAARSDARFREARRFIEASGCRACPWSCAATASVLYEPANWPLLTRASRAAARSAG